MCCRGHCGRGCKTVCCHPCRVSYCHQPCVRRSYGGCCGGVRRCSYYVCNRSCYRPHCCGGGGYYYGAQYSMPATETHYTYVEPEVYTVEWM